MLESAFTCTVGHRPHTRTMRLMGAQSPVPLTPPSTRLFPWSQRGEGEGRPGGRRGRHDQPRRVQPPGPGFDGGPDSLWMFEEQQLGFTISPKKKRKAKSVLGGGPCMLIKLLQSCLSLCDPMDCRPPHSCVHGILQTKTLECVAMPSSRGPSRPRDEGGLFTTSATWEAPLRGGEGFIKSVELFFCLRFQLQTQQHFSDLFPSPGAMYTLISTALCAPNRRIPNWLWLLPSRFQ